MNLTDQYTFFFDDDLFVETDHPGFRRRVIIGDHLELWFWRIKGGDVVLFDAASGLVVVDKTLTAPIVHAPPDHQRVDRGQDQPGGRRHHPGFGDTLLIRNEHRYDM